MSNVQSPIAICTRASKHVDDVQPLQFHGHLDAVGVAFIENTGHSATVTFAKRTRKPYIVGGPLPTDEQYVFEQLHFHWADVDDSGGEHTLEGQRYSMEAHIVHYNSKYKDFQEAVGKNDGIAVVAVFIQASGDRDCNEFAKIADCVRHIQQPKSKCAINSDCLSFLSFLELSKHYYTYKGSLTTEPYSECVTWIIYRTPIYVSQQQVAVFRELRSCSTKKIDKNYRPIQSTAEKVPSVTFARNYRIKAKL